MRVLKKRAKTTLLERRDMVRLHRSRWYTQKTLAKIYGVTQARVSQIILGR